MNSVPKVQTTDRNVNQLQSNIVPKLNALLGNAIVNGQILKNQALKSGSNTINTGLNRALVGWLIVRQRGSASIYDTQDSNPTPNATLQLVSSAAVTVDLWVF